MSKFHPLTVASVTRETRDAIALTFEVPPPLRSLSLLQGGT
jgi:ring-1,2-phenylacetyl-CoA epoxidase subunit PaaE